MSQLFSSFSFCFVFLSSLYHLTFLGLSTLFPQLKNAVDDIIPIHFIGVCES